MTHKPEGEGERLLARGTLAMALNEMEDAVDDARRRVDGIVFATNHLREMVGEQRPRSFVIRRWLVELVGRSAGTCDGMARFVAAEMQLRLATERARIVLGAKRTNAILKTTREQRRKGV